MQIGLIGELICPPTLSTLISRFLSDIRSCEHASNLFSTLITPLNHRECFPVPADLIGEFFCLRPSPEILPQSVRAWNEIALEKRFITTRSERFSSADDVDDSPDAHAVCNQFCESRAIFSPDTTFLAYAAGGKAVRGESSAPESRSASKRRVKVQKSLDEVQSRRCQTHTTANVVRKKNTKNIILKNVFFFAFEYRKSITKLLVSRAHEVTERNLRHPRWKSRELCAISRHGAGVRPPTIELPKFNIFG